MSGDFRIRPAKSDDGSSIVALFNEIFPEKRRLSHWQWKYLENPINTPCMLVVEKDDNIIGHQAIVPFWMNLGGNRVLGGKTADRMVHPDYRKHGIGASLLKELMLTATSSGFELVFNIPNQQSYPSMAKHFGHFEGQWPHRVRVLNPRAIIERRTGSPLIAALADKPAHLVLNLWRGGGRLKSPKDVNIKEIDRFDRSFDDLWQKVKSRFLVSIWKDSAYLNWRYIACPDRKYTVITAESPAGLLGFMVLRTNIENWRSGRIVDFVFQPEKTREASLLLSTGLRYLKDLGMEIASCHITEQNPYRRLFRSHGFFKYGAGLPVVARIFSPKVPSDAISTIGKWYLIEGDDIDQF